MAVTNNYSNTGLLPSTMLEPFGAKALQYGIGQLGTPINSQALSPQVAGQSAFQQKAAQGLADMSGLGNVQRDASGQVTGFTGVGPLAVCLAPTHFRITQKDEPEPYLANRG